MTSIFRAMTMQTFFFPRRDAIFQNFVARKLLRERAIAPAASHWIGYRKLDKKIG